VITLNLKALTQAVKPLESQIIQPPNIPAASCSKINGKTESDNVIRSDQMARNSRSTSKAKAELPKTKNNPAAT